MSLQYPGRPPHLRWWLALLLAWFAFHGAAGAATQQTASESAVKAAFLFRMAGLVEWPAGTFRRPEDPLVIAVAGHDGVAGDLEQIVTGRAIDGRPVVVRRVREGEAFPDRVHVLMIGAATREARVRELTARPDPMLVVTDHENGHGLGAVINFVPDRGRVRFTASLPAAEARGLRLSARLLAVAHSVEGRVR